jgi:multidrug resistance efflux pump
VFAQADRSTTQASSAAFQRAFDVSDAALRETQRALDDTRLVAPIDGWVARRLVDNFQSVQAHQPVFVFQNNAMLEVDIQVPEAHLLHFERRRKVKILY